MLQMMSWDVGVVVVEVEMAVEGKELTSVDWAGATGLVGWGVESISRNAAAARGCDTVGGGMPVLCRVE